MPDVTNKIDISRREDIVVVLTDFYTHAFDDSIIGFMFTDVAKADLQEHVQTITVFWAAILFKEEAYQGNVMQKHRDLNGLVPLKAGHFTRWLYLFEKSLDKHFSGKNVDLMKRRARMIAEKISDSLGRDRGEVARGVDMLDDLLGS